MKSATALVLIACVGLAGIRPLVSALYRASVLRRLRASGRMPTDAGAGVSPPRRGPPGDAPPPPER